MNTAFDNETIQVWLHRFIKEGDEESFSQIYMLFVDELYGYGKSFDVNENTVEDIIQDLFCHLYLNKAQLSKITNLKSYLFRSLKNRILDTYKKKSSVSFDAVAEEVLVFSLKVSVEEDYVEEEEREVLESRINQMLECLSPQQKEIIYLRFNEEMSYEEIAGVLNCSQEVVRKSISRSIAKMKKENKMLVAIFLLLFWS